MNSPVNFDSNWHMKMIFKSVLFAYSVKLYISHKIGYNFESSQPKGHSGQLWLKLVRWFQRRRYLKKVYENGQWTTMQSDSKSSHGFVWLVYGV